MKLHKPTYDLHREDQSGSLPSVLHLVQAMIQDQTRCNQLNDAKDALGQTREDRLQHRSLDASDFFSSDRQHALSALAKSIPAETLGDAAAHIALAYSIGEDILGNNHDEYREGLLHRQLRRCLSSALRVVAETAGVNIESIGGYWIDEAFGRDFPDLAEQAGARWPA